MSIFQNAIDSIQIGIEDYKNEDKRRNLSSVRNIFSGILLLYKYKLSLLSPDYDKELLIKKEIIPTTNENGDLIFKGKGSKTVDVHSIKERFSSLGIDIKWKNFQRVNTLRNNIEHYHTSEPQHSVKEIISDSFLLIQDFLKQHLSLDPKITLGDEAWKTLIEVDSFYKKEKESCKEKLSKIDFRYNSVTSSLEHLHCEKCHSSLVEPISENKDYKRIEFKCRICDHKFSSQEAIEQCINKGLAGKEIRSFMDGGGPLIYPCFKCGKKTFITEENCCVACGYTKDFINCTNCGEELEPDEQINEGLCGNCVYDSNKYLRYKSN